MRRARPVPARGASTLTRPGGSGHGAQSVDGALNLDEARRLVAERLATPAIRRQRSAPLTPGHLALQRLRLARERQQEQIRRLREYRAVMTLLKRYGVRPEPASMPGERRRTRGAASPGPALQPLQILAEGDSWFDYPVPLFGGGVIKRLERRLGVPILNMAEPGDELRHMLGVGQRRRLRRRLQEGCPAGGAWDLLLFSGGGNDLVDDPMALWILDWRRGATPDELLHARRFDAALELLRAGYEDLIALRDELSPRTHLLLHAYDFAIPDGRGLCHHGPWLKPSFELRGFPDQKSAAQVVRAMLIRFAGMLETLQTHAGVSVLPTQGTLAPKSSAWHNELHPGKAGFEAITGLFQSRIRQLFPGRVL